MKKSKRKQNQKYEQHKQAVKDILEKYLFQPVTQELIDNVGHDIAMYMYDNVSGYNYDKQEYIIPKIHEHVEYDPEREELSGWINLSGYKGLRGDRLTFSVKGQNLHYATVE